MKIKFVHYLFTPTLVVLAYWILSIPILISPHSNLIESNFYNIFIAVVLILIAIGIVVKFVGLIFAKQYKNVVAVLIGIPVALIIAYVSIIALFSTSGI